MGRLNTPLTIFSIYNSFAYVRDTAEEVCGNLKTKCWVDDYYEFMDFGNFYFRINSFKHSATYKISISIDKHEYKYYYDLVTLLKSHKGWAFEISEYNHYMDKFYVYFRRPRISGSEIHIYSISGKGINLASDDFTSKVVDYICNDTLDDFNRKVANYLYNDTICVYETYKDILAANQKPTLSKPPIFNPPATICYWTDGTKTVVKCQEVDTYSPEAGLALCYMKKVLGNTSKDLNKELHKYISEEKEK